MDSFSFSILILLASSLFLMLILSTSSQIITPFSNSFDQNQVWTQVNKNALQD